MLKRKAMVSIPDAAEKLKLSSPTVSQAIQRLEKLGIASEVTGKQRDRHFCYVEYLNLLNADTEPG